MFVCLAFEAAEAETIASVLFLDFINSLEFSLSLSFYAPILIESQRIIIWDQNQLKS